jgi:hypothetical protein
MKRLIVIFSSVLFVCFIGISFLSCAGLRPMGASAEGPQYKCRAYNTSDYQVKLTVERLDSRRHDYEEYYKTVLNVRVDSCGEFPGVNFGLTEGEYRITVELYIPGEDIGIAGKPVHKTEETFELAREDIERENAIEYGHGGNGHILIIEVSNPAI